MLTKFMQQQNFEERDFIIVILLFYVLTISHIRFFFKLAFQSGGLMWNTLTLMASEVLNIKRNVHPLDFLLLSVNIFWYSQCACNLTTKYTLICVS